MHAMASDEVLKNTLASAAFEQFEAASYRMLVTAAQVPGKPQIAKTCETINGTGSRDGGLGVGPAISVDRKISVARRRRCRGAAMKTAGA